MPVNRKEREASFGCRKLGCCSSRSQSYFFAGSKEISGESNKLKDPTAAKKTHTPRCGFPLPCLPKKTAPNRLRFWRKILSNDRRENPTTPLRLRNVRGALPQRSIIVAEVEKKPMGRIPYCFGQRASRDAHLAFWSLASWDTPKFNRPARRLAGRDRPRRKRVEAKKE